MSSRRIDVGELVRIATYKSNDDGTYASGGFKDVSGDLFDPSDVMLTLRPPSGETEDLSADVVKDSTGLYHIDYVVTEAGLHLFRWEGDTVIEQSAFMVEANDVGVPAS